MPEHKRWENKKSCDAPFIYQKICARTSHVTQTLRARLYLVLGCDQLAACQRIDIDRFIFDTFVHRRSPVYTIGYLVVTRNQVFILYFIMAIPYSSPQATLPTDPAPCYLLRRSPTVCSSSVFRADPQPHE